MKKNTVLHRAAVPAPGVSTPRADLIRTARGESPADLVLKNARLVNVYSGEIHPADVAIQGSMIAGVGAGYRGRSEIDLEGAYVAPGLIDAHVHIESSMVDVRQYAAAVVPRGVTAVVADPHEIANVLGLDGIRYMFDCAKHGCMSMYVMAPSCVPATGMATAGACLEAKDIAALRGDPWVPGLAEMMNYPGVVRAEPAVMDKLEAFKGRVLDGHAPGLSGMGLAAYVAAGIGSDHECTTVEEAREKLGLGMYVLLRDATGAHDLPNLLPLITGGNERRICFCTDDRHPADLLDEGGVDHLVRFAIRAGIDPVTAIRMATLNPAEWFRLHNRGGIRPGNFADLFVFSDLREFSARMVMRGGEIVARDGALLSSVRPARPAYLRNSMNIGRHPMSFRIPADGKKARVIGVVQGSLITESRLLALPSEDGAAVADPGRDIAKLAVLERHMASGRVGLGFVQGLGLKQGAIASTISHDHHNLIVAGADDASMYAAAEAVAEMGGGLAAARGERVLARLPLPIAGLMSDKPIAEVRRELDALISAARELGTDLPDPFMTIGFLGLEVIPHLKLTDLGLVDVDRFSLTSLWENP